MARKDAKKRPADVSTRTNKMISRTPTLAEWPYRTRPRPVSTPWAVSLIARFGGDVLMPDVRHLIAECPHKDAPGAACGVYSDLRERSD
jgi:hypothetical protein